MPLYNVFRVCQGRHKLVFTGEERKARAFAKKRRDTDGGGGSRAEYVLREAPADSKKYAHRHKHRSH